MKEAIIHNLYPPDGIGGAERVVEEGAERSSRKGNDVVVITTSVKPVREHYRNLTIIRLRPSNLYVVGKGRTHSFLLRFLWNSIDSFNLGTFYKVKKILKQEKPSIVTCHNLKGIGLFIPDAVYALAIPLKLYLHDVQYVAPSGIMCRDDEQHPLKRVGYALYGAFVRSLLRSPNEVISPSRWLMDFYVSRGFFKRSKKTVLPFPKERFNAKLVSERLTLFKRKVERRDAVFLLYVGKLEVHKGILFLIDVWKSLPSYLTLAIVGKGDTEEAMRKSVLGMKNILFLGEKNRADVKKEMRKADALILPTLCYENRPQVILEAYEEGLPVIASNLGGIPEFVTHGKTGLLFQDGDAQSLKRLLLVS